MKSVIIIVLGLLLFNHSNSLAQKPVDTMAIEKTHTLKTITEGCYLIDKAGHEILNSTPYNPAKDGMESEHRFTDEFATEISDVQKLFFDYFSKHGKFGSSERYLKEPSDWWIGDDFYSTSRVLFVDILNPDLQEYSILQGAQKELSKLKNNWMLLIGHDNAYNALGEYVEKPGEYFFWVTSESIKIYSKREEDIQIFLNSIKKSK